jgi:hypothetical protein
MGTMAKVVARHEASLLAGRTWGDGLYLVFDDLCGGRMRPRAPGGAGWPGSRVGGPGRAAGHEGRRPRRYGV